MDLKLEWQKPVPLRSVRGKGLIYALDLEKLPKAPGIYVFARRWGKGFEALYVGKANNIRGRTKQQLNNLRLVSHLKQAKAGDRVIIAGRSITKPAQKTQKVLALLERAFIRHFVAEGHDLVNKKGVRIRRHSIESDGPVSKKFIPSLMFLEKSKGQ